MRRSHIVLLTHTQTHSFNDPLSGTTRVSLYQKGKTNLDFTKARDSEWQWHRLGRMQVCTSLQTDNHASTPPLSFLQAGCPSCRPTNSVKALKANHSLTHSHKNHNNSRQQLPTASDSVYVYIRYTTRMIGTLRVHSVHHMYTKRTDRQPVYTHAHGTVSVTTRHSAAAINNFLTLV